MRTLIGLVLALVLVLVLIARPARGAEPFVTIGYLPLATTSEEIMIRGTAPRGSLVDVYDNGDLVLRIVAMAEMDVYRAPLAVPVGEHRIVAQVEGTEVAARALFFRTDDTFCDIAGHWAGSDIEIMATLGVISGMGDGTFGPEESLTRAQFAKLLVLGLEREPSADLVPGFADADRIPDWARGYVGTAVNLGLIRGYEDNTFRPDARVTRAEVAVMAARALQLKQSQGDALVPWTGDAYVFADADAIPGWAETAATYLVGATVIGPYWGTHFDANQPATRALAAAVTRRIWTVGLR